MYLRYVSPFLIFKRIMVDRIISHLELTSVPDFGFLTPTHARDILNP